jgi:acetate kinase
MKVLILNSGSSSLKFQLMDMGANPAVLAKGLIEKIGAAGSKFKFEAEGQPPARQDVPIADHQRATELAFVALRDSGIVAHPSEIEGVGHRVVHGGEHFSQSVLVTNEVIRKIELCSELAPLHNPHNLKGYYASRQVLPQAQHVVVFDTAFHATLAPHAFLYGVPYEYYERYKVRRYGFHGSSHRYIAMRMAELLGNAPSRERLISCHLGNGCSVCAIDKARSVDTSMGFTPQEGLLMGTRAGDIDAMAVLYLMDRAGLDGEAMETLLNHQSGLLGVSGTSNDMRDLLQQASQGNRRAALAVEIFCHRVRKYIGAYLAVLGGAGAIVFTGGIGENAAAVRASICEPLRALGVAVDASANERRDPAERAVSTPASKTAVWVVPSGEELIIAGDTVRCILELRDAGRTV